MASAADLSDQERLQSYLMERAILDVRRHWFEAREEDLGHALSMCENGGELVSLVDAEPDEADRLLADAVARGAYVVATDFSRPSDLPVRLRRDGYRSIQRHGIYVFDAAPSQATEPPYRSLLSRLTARPPAKVEVHTIGETELPAWNEVCWKAFGSNGSVEIFLAEKRRAYRSMGARGTWLLARVGGRAVGVACLYEGEGASQVLAVGTLPSFRGRGVATAVMRRLIAIWAERHAGLLFLDTKPGSGAERLYLGLGFRLAYVRELFAPHRGSA